MQDIWAKHTRDPARCPQPRLVPWPKSKGVSPLVSRNSAFAWVLGWSGNSLCWVFFGLFCSENDLQVTKDQEPFYLLILPVWVWFTLFLSQDWFLFIFAHVADASYRSVVGPDRSWGAAHSRCRTLKAGAPFESAVTSGSPGTETLAFPRFWWGMGIADDSQICYDLILVR